jgi:hypothetical protein
MILNQGFVVFQRQSIEDNKEKRLRVNEAKTPKRVGGTKSVM